MKLTDYIKSQWLTFDDIARDLPDISRKEINQCLQDYVKQGYYIKQKIEGVWFYQRTNKLPPYELERLR